jgi:hypothetical protein
MSRTHARARVWDVEEDHHRPRPTGARRTVRITGRPEKLPARATPERAPATVIQLPSRGPRLVEVERRRPPRRPAERLGSQPDRLALWALALGLFLVAVVLVSP